MKAVLQSPKPELIRKIAEELKQVQTVKAPVWATFVKTGANRSRPPVQKDWWYTRAASVLLKVSDRGPVGVSKLQTLYGGRKRRGHQPPEFRRGSGSIIRNIFHQLEKAGLLVQAPRGMRKGRVVTKQAAALLLKADGRQKARKKEAKHGGKRAAKPVGDAPKAGAGGETLPAA